jgi:hypothetical protein
MIKDGTAIPVGSGSGLRYLDAIGKLIVKSDIPDTGGPWPEGSRTLFKEETVNVAEMKIAYLRRQTQQYQRLRKFLVGGGGPGAKLVETYDPKIRNYVTWNSAKKQLVMARFRDKHLVIPPKWWLEKHASDTSTGGRSADEGVADVERADEELQIVKRERTGNWKDPVDDALNKFETSYPPDHRFFYSCKHLLSSPSYTLPPLHT